MLTFLTSYLGVYMASKVIGTLGTVLGLVLADFIFGVLLALKNGEFAWSKLSQFVQTSLVPYVGGLLVLALFAGSNTELSALFFTIAATITVKFIADVGTKVSQLFGGLNIQIQSPIQVSRPTSDSQTQPITPVTDTATNTPAADKTVPAEDSQPAQTRSQTQAAQ